MASKRTKGVAPQTDSRRDAIMKNIWLRLHSDFYPANTPSAYENAFEALKRGDIGSFRRNLPTADPCIGGDIGRVKRRIQLNSWCDRYIFRQDPQDDEIEYNTLTGMLDDLPRIATWKEWSHPVTSVMREARRVIREILGPYDPDEHLSSCQFGRRASIGNPYQRAYLDVKLIEDPLTGSSAQIKWFAKSIAKANDVLLLRCLGERSKDARYFTVVDRHKQAFAPKNWKKKRGILKNTLIGTFYTYGLGKMFERRLKNARLNIKRLQEKHKRLACRASKDGSLTTADLKGASDSVTVRHVLYLLPRPWWRACSLGRIKLVEYEPAGPNGPVSVFATETFAGMGNGMTFTLQSLLYYGILVAIANLTKIDGKISVYGDDLIYPTQLHKYVVRVFEEIGFILNHSKTFATGHFRESCGGDYFKGCDVRPVRPEGSHSEFEGKKALTSFLYKLRNGLRRRWAAEEIPLTLAYIDQQLCCVGTELHLVPPLFPDTAGRRIKTPHGDYDDPVGWWVHVKRPKFNVIQQRWTFWYLRLEMQSRIVVSENPYYWDSMRGSELKQPTRWGVIHSTPALTRGWLVSWEEEGKVQQLICKRRPKGRWLKGKEVERCTLGSTRDPKAYTTGTAHAYEWVLAQVQRPMNQNP